MRVARDFNFKNRSLNDVLDSHISLNKLGALYDYKDDGVRQNFMKQAGIHLYSLFSPTLIGSMVICY